MLEDRSALVVAGLEAREVVPGARAGARRGPEAHAPGDEVGPRGPGARPVARRRALRGDGVRNFQAGRAPLNFYPKPVLLPEARRGSKSLDRRGNYNRRSVFAITFTAKCWHASVLQAASYASTDVEK